MTITERLTSEYQGFLERVKKQEDEVLQGNCRTVEKALKEIFDINVKVSSLPVEVEGYEFTVNLSGVGHLALIIRCPKCTQIHNQLDVYKGGLGVLMRDMEEVHRKLTKDNVFHPWQNDHCAKSSIKTSFLMPSLSERLGEVVREIIRDEIGNHLQGKGQW